MACHLPPLAVATLRRFNSAAIAVRLKPCCPNSTNNGIPRDDISIVASNAEGRYSDEQSRSGRFASNRVDRDRDGTDDRAEGAAIVGNVESRGGGFTPKREEQPHAILAGRAEGE